MMTTQSQSMSLEAYRLYACLPFVKLARESMIGLGPVIFWPASKSHDFLNAGEHELFQKYLETIAQIKARCQADSLEYVNTIKLSPEGTTCISTHQDVPLEAQELVLIEALYLLYFACSFRNLYFGNEIPSFSPLSKVVPASLEFFSSKRNWEHLYINEASREETICISITDLDIFTGLGKALEIIFIPSANTDAKTVQECKRLVRSIRYFVDRFFQRFVNLFNKGLQFPDELFEAEDVIFLSTSFETLFDIDEKYPAADFKHKLRPLLHLKYGNPVELFWKWADDFYEVRRRIIFGDTILNPIFHINPNFEIPHIFLGIKLFIYSVYYTLYKYHLIQSIHEDPYTPPDFKWIHPAEILLFFWTESNLLRKLSLFILQVQQSTQKDELLAEIFLLTKLFVTLYERYFKQEYPAAVRFIPTPLHELSDYGKQIIELLNRELPSSQLLQTLHPHFKHSLEERLKPKSS